MNHFKCTSQNMKLFQFIYILLIFPLFSVWFKFCIVHEWNKMWTGHIKAANIHGKFLCNFFLILINIFLFKKRNDKNKRKTKWNVFSSLLNAFFFVLKSIAIKNSMCSSASYLNVYLFKNWCVTKPFRFLGLTQLHMIYALYYVIAFYFMKKHDLLDESQ